MNQALRQAIDRHRLREARVARQVPSSDIEEHVLAIPLLYLLIFPDPPADGIDGDIAERAEQAIPVVGPLFIDMPGAPLAGDRRREEDYGGERREGANELSGRSGREMLGDLQADGEIKGTIDADGAERLVEVRGDEAGLRNAQIVSRDVRPIDSQDVVDAVAPERGEPGTR